MHDKFWVRQVHPSKIGVQEDDVTDGSTRTTEKKSILVRRERMNVEGNGTGEERE